MIEPTSFVFLCLPASPSHSFEKKWLSGRGGVILARYRSEREHNHRFSSDITIVGESDTVFSHVTIK